MTNYFKDNLKYIREQKGLSQNKLSMITKVNQSTIVRWENGEISPTIDNVIDLMEALKLPISEIGPFLGEDLKAKKMDVKLLNYELLFEKTKNILSDSDKDTIEFIMNKAIENYEKSKE